MISGKILKAYREKMGISQKEFAELSGVDPGVVCAIEKGIEKRFSLRMAVRVANTMGVTVDYLLGRTAIRHDVADPILRKIIRAYMQIDEDDRKLMERFVEFLAGKVEDGPDSILTMDTEPSPWI